MSLALNLRWILSLLLYFTPFHIWAQPSHTQIIPLTTGWNLVSFQVGGPLTISDFMSHLQTNGLLAIYTMDPGSKSWFFWKSNAPLSTLDTLYPQRGYWVQISRPNSLTLTGPISNHTNQLSPGWNLVGFPGLTFDPTEQLDLTSVFRNQLGSVPRIWRFDGGTSQRFVGYDTLMLPAVTELKAVEPGKGYFVYCTTELLLTPLPTIALAADSDVSPLQPEEIFDPSDPRFHGANPGDYLDKLVRFSAGEDTGLDLNANGILDSPFTQDTMLFGSGMNQQHITIANVGNGLMNWSLASASGWVTANPPAGVTGTELDTVQITVDRSGLVPGYYTNTLTLYAGSLTKLVTVILQVPTVAGDYRGAATVTRVNGKEISLGKVDLNLSMFNETTNVTDISFRGVINRDKALLFPKDVFMTGIFYQGNDFSLTTSFEMPAGDRNAPPYNSFTHITNDALANPAAQPFLTDKDWNQDGVLDNANIFPFAIRREVTLLGTRLSADRLEGTYIEAIANVLPNGQRIYIEGSFALDRETLAPTIKSIYNDGTNAIIAIGGSAGGRSSITNRLNVTSGVRIQGTVLTVKYDFPAPQELAFCLSAPGGAPVYCFTTNVTGNVVVRIPDFNGLIGQGTWTLVVTWNPLSGERGFFNGWELNLEGLAFYNVSGSVVTINGGVTNPVSDASVTLAGSNIIPQSNTTTNGAFAFTGLTENDYFLTVTKLGYQPVTRAFNINAADVNLGQIILLPLTVTNAIVTASPFIGQSPLHVSFTPLVPTASLSALGSNVIATWSFGDGVTNIADGDVPVSHSYTNAGAFVASVTLNGSAGSLTLNSETVIALASAPNITALPSATHFLFGVGFISSIASPINSANVLEVAPVAGSTNFALYQESKRDSAAFDLDRFPVIGGTNVFRPNAEDTDFFTQPGTVFHTQSPVTADGVYSTNVYRPYRIISTLGGYVFSPESTPWKDQSARVGNFVLQVGRIEE